MNFKHHLWPQTGESAIPSDWQVYTDTLRYLRRNFPAGTNGNKPIYFFLSIGCSKLWKSLHMPTLTCQAFVSIILTHAYYTCFIHVSPTLPLSLTFQASSMMMRFFTLQSQTIQTHQHILYIYIVFLWNRCRPNMTCGCKQPPVFPANIKEPILIFQNCVRPNPAVCHNVPY